MNENVKQNQPVSLFSFLILRVAGLLNSADFSRSCTSSSCNISLSFSSSALTQARRRRRLFPIACLDSRLSSLTPPTVPKCLAILGRWKTRSCILGATLPLKTLGNTTPTSRQRVSRRSSSFSSRNLLAFNKGWSRRSRWHTNEDLEPSFWLGLVWLSQVYMQCTAILQTKINWRWACNWAKIW